MENNPFFATSDDGTRIWVEHRGDISKPCIVWVHGLSCSALPFDKQFADPRFVENYFMVRYETRGHGRSDAPMLKEAYESIRHAQDFRTVCEAVGVKECFIAGWSLGGIIPADYFAAYGTEGSPITILGVIYLGAMIYRTMHPLVVHPIFVELVSRFIPAITFDPVTQVEDVAHMITPASIIQEFVDSCVAPGTQDRVSKVEAWKWMGAIVTQHPLVRYFTLRRTQDHTPLMSVATLPPSDPKSLPILAIHGTEDTHMVASKHEEWCKANLGNLVYVTLEGVGHAPFWEAEEEVCMVVRRFCERVLADRA